MESAPLLSPGGPPGASPDPGGRGASPAGGERVVGGRPGYGSVSPVPFGAYLERDPTAKEWVLRHWPTRHSVARYIRSLFPFVGWLPRYNTTWLLGDAIGGVTLGFVVVPQTMAYALLAGLPPQHGLYTSFVGTSLYWLFGTSKDVAIGATAVVSLLTGRIVGRVTESNPEYRNVDVAECVSVMAGCCLLIFGILRLDWVVELIPLVAISAFVTGAAITISLSQWPTILGISGIETKGSAISAILQLLGRLGETQLGDAAVGLSALVLLEGIKWYCGHMANGPRNKQRIWNTFSSLRMTLVMCIYTAVSFAANHGRPLEDSSFRLLGPVPSGMTEMGAPFMDKTLMASIGPNLPAVVLVLIVEHIAIAKSFGKTNNYVVVPSQEMVASGMTNLIGPLFGAYPSTGSFTGTAILSKAGVCTPLAGTFNAAIVMLALYCLTSVFYYIPMAALSGLIVHAVSNLVTPPSELRRYWQVSPPDLLIYVVGVAVSVFENLEHGIYTTAGLSLIFLLFRVARPQGKFLGRARVVRYSAEQQAVAGGPSDGDPDAWRGVYISHERDDGTNPHVKVEAPCPGVFIFKLTENMHYLNQAYIVDQVVAHVTSRTRRTLHQDHKTARERPWNDPGPGTSEAEPSEALPPLHALVLDMSAVNAVDVTSVQGLIDLRHRLSQWAFPSDVEFHFANVTNRWTRKALASAGFGQPPSLQEWHPEFSIAELGSSSRTRKESTSRGGASAEALEQNDYVRHVMTWTSDSDFIHSGGSPRGFGTLAGVDRPHFHPDLETAVEFASRSLQRRRRVMDEEHTNRGES